MKNTDISITYLFIAMLEGGGCVQSKGRLKCRQAGTPGNKSVKANTLLQPQRRAQLDGSQRHSRVW